MRPPGANFRRHRGVGTVQRGLLLRGMPAGNTNSPRPTEEAAAEPSEKISRGCGVWVLRLWNHGVLAWIGAVL